MSNIILTESELKLRMAQIYKEERISILKEKWETFSKNEKIFVLEFYKALHPESKLLQESKWYNWVGDIVGFIPGLELVNIINGVSYWNQGEKLFALLSFLAGVPGLGFVLGPVKLLLKGGGTVAKGLRSAVAVGDASKLASIGAKSSVVGKLISSVGGWGVSLLGILMRVLEKVPGLRLIIGGIKSLLHVFTDAKGKLESKPNINVSGNKTDIPNLNSKLKVGKTNNSLNTSGSNDPISNMMSSMFGAK